MKDMFKKILYFVGLAMCLVACEDKELDPEKIKEIELRGAIAGKWIYDHPEEGQWEEAIYTSSGRIYVSFMTGINLQQLQLDRKDGVYQLSGNKLDVVYTGSHKFSFDLTEITDSELTFVALSANGESFTYNKQLDEYNLVSGKTLQPNYLSLIKSGETISGYKSHCLTIAEVDSQGKITAKEAGYTYIDVETSNGTYVVRVNVTDPENLYPDYTDALLMNEQEVIERWGKDYYYNGVDGFAYLVNNDYISNVLFFTDEDRNIVRYWLLLNTAQMESSELENAIHSYLSSKYIFLETVEGVNRYYGSDNDGFSFIVLYSPEEETISYMKISVPDLWRDYSLDLGKTVNQLLTEYGNPVMVDDEGWIYYWEENEYVSFRAYELGATNQNVRRVWAFLQDNFDGQVILNELQRKFVYFESGSIPSENYFAFTNEEKSVGVIFNGYEGYIVYVDLTASSSSRANENWMPSKKEYSQKAQSFRNLR